MKKALLLVLAIAFATTATACKTQTETQTPYLANDRKIVVGLEAAYPPMEFVDGTTGEMTGFDVELMKAIAAYNGWEIQFANVGWDGIFIGLESEQYDVICSSVSINQERIDEGMMIFTKPYVSNGQFIIIPKGTTDLEGLSDLAGLKVGVQAATTADYACKDFLATSDTVQFNLMSYDDVQTALMALESRQIDVVVTDAPVAIGFVLERPDAFEISSVAMTNEPIAIAIKRGNTELQSKLNETIDALRANGTLKNLSLRYLGEDYTTVIDETLW